MTGSSPVPAVDEWAMPARMVPVELLLAGDECVLGPNVSRVIAATAAHRRNRDRVEQWVRFTDDRTATWEHGSYVHVRCAEDLA